MRKNKSKVSIRENSVCMPSRHFLANKEQNLYSPLRPVEHSEH